MNLEHLNEAQRRAVTHRGGPLLILAGAGTGKTRTLIHRIAWLIEQGQAPSGILALTFTHRAADEMRGRLESLIGAPATRARDELRDRRERHEGEPQALASVTWGALQPRRSEPHSGSRDESRAARERGGSEAKGFADAPQALSAALPRLSTFHSLGALLLRGWAGRFGRTSGFHIYGERERLGLLAGALDAHGCPSDAEQVKLTAAAIAGLKQGRPLEAPSESGEGEAGVLDGGIRVALEAIRATYEARLRACDAFDLEDLIARPVEALRASPELRARLQARWPVVLVDEFQDTNAAQLDLLEALAPPGSELTVVGDDDQAIYEWRGADVEGILRFNDRWGGDLIRLERNYRSTAQILEAANAFIAHNARRLGKALHTELEGAPLRLYEARDDRVEARWIAAQIQRLHEEEGLPYGHAAILTRTHAQARELEAALDLLCVPHASDSRGARVESALALDALAYLRLLDNPVDEIAARRILLRTVKGIGAKTVERLAARAAELGVGLLAVPPELLKPRAGRALAGLSRLLDEARVGLTPPLAPKAWALLDEVGLLAEEDEGIDHLLAWLRQRPEITLNAALEGLALNARAGGGVEVDAVRLLTIHAAKGLEFEAVFLPGLEVGLVPHARAAARGELESERRLFYVALTRAARHLTLSWSRARRGFEGPPKAAAPSPFLSLLPLDACEGDIEAASAPARRPLTGGLEVGTEASHPKLGVVEIIELLPQGMARVRGADGRARTLAVRFLERA